jgi:hypothetical protein
MRRKETLLLSVDGRAAYTGSGSGPYVRIRSCVRTEITRWRTVNHAVAVSR